MRRQAEATPDQIVPPLEGWLPAVEIAQTLGISRQSVARMMADGVFRTLRAVGERPLYVVREEEVAAFLELRKEHYTWARAAAELAKLSDRRVGAHRT